jgi:hypothetical protein
MMKKVFVFGLVLVCMISVLAGCGTKDKSENFKAKIIEIYEDSVLVEAVEGESIRSSSDLFTFGTKELEEIGIMVGDLVTITHTGEIRESYPAQITVISWEIHEKAD